MSSKTYLNNLTYFKPNYFEALKYIIPQYLTEDDTNNFGKEVDLKDQIINSHIDVAQNISSLINISSIPGTVYSSLNTLEGIAPYFIKQNELTRITPEVFETKILDRLNKSFKNFNTSSEFSNYLETTLLPSITLNHPSSNFYGSDAASTIHIYLIENLSWLYFLNTSGLSYNPSSFVRDILTSKTFKGEDITLNDCLKGLEEFIWKNNYTNYYPSTFVSSTNTYTSGVQQLDKLKTWIDILYSPLYTDRSDFTVRDKFDFWIQNSLKSENYIASGPFTKLLRAISFLAFDITDTNNLINTFYAIEECPDNLLPFVADLIGWNLFGNNPQRWRLQLRNAIEVYKKVGTKKSLQFALNTVFPKDIFNIESRIIELWESYIPYLIYYSLATESEYFRTYSDWTPSLASRMNVVGYSSSSLDDNIKLATDRIVYETYLRFKNSFYLPQSENKFFYRGREYPIPPFEEYPYYINTEVSREMIDFIVDRLVCFGVRQAFALQVRDYLYDNLLNSDDEIRSSSWLFFTADYNEPPNLSNIINNIADRKFEYASLWSGKSSHFKLTFDAEEFDFSKKEDELDSGDAVILASKVINEFSPAHAIPLINFSLSAIDYQYLDSSNIPLLNLDKVELGFGNSTRNYFTSSLIYRVYNDSGASGGYNFGRSEQYNLASRLYNGYTVSGNLPRTALVKRNYDQALPLNGLYTRSGLNSPASFYMLSSLSGVPLGFIPSSLSFEPIPDHINLPEVYKSCYTVSSPAYFYGYAVSSTFLARGHTGIGAIDFHNDRGQLSPAIAAMHYIGEQSKIILASALYSPTSSTSAFELKFSSVAQSLANSATENLNWFPSSINDYSNFKFGKEFHKYYKEYTKEFDRHKLAPHIYDLDGPNIFSHTFGPLLINSNFSQYGQYGNQFIGSSIAGVNYLNTSHPVFSTPLNYGTFIASSASSMYIDTYEFVNSGILNAVELVMPSGGSFRNSFGIIRLNTSSSIVENDSYFYNNTFIRLTAYDELPRVRFDVRRYQAQSPNPLSQNFLLPDDEYELNLKYLLTNNKITEFGGRSVGIWIHTKPEGDKMWSWTNNGEWVQHSALITRQDLINNYAIIQNQILTQNTNRTTIESEGGYIFECIDLQSGTSSIAVTKLLESNFEKLTVKFNTKNRTIVLPNSYLTTYGLLHRKNQDYIIEVFLLPSTEITDRYLLLDKVEVKNLSLKKMSEILVIDGCPQYRVELSKERIGAILRFWNDIAGKNSTGSFLTRNSSTAINVIPTQGNSRLDYRLRLDWLRPDYTTLPIPGSYTVSRLVEVSPIV